MHKCSMLCDCNEQFGNQVSTSSSVVDGIESLSDNADKVFDQSSLFLNCNYYDTISLNGQILNRSNTNDLVFIHFNIRSLQKNINKLTHYISQFHKLPDVIPITETKLQNDTIYNNIDIAGYNFIYADSKQEGLAFT